jgi:hypothetical protein
MNQQCIVCLIATFFLMTESPHLYGQRQGQNRDAVENEWRLDYQAAREEARNSNKPMMVVLRCVP